MKIESKIVVYKVLKDEEKALKKEEVVEKPKIKLETLERPETLVGTTTKIKSHLSDHALYVTFCDIVLFEGTEFEEKRPYEIFINSKNPEHFQWILALTRIISAVLRKGGDYEFLIAELKEVFDPKGGYFKKGGRFVPSLVAEIGYAMENHVNSINPNKKAGLSEEQKRFIEEKRAEIESNSESALEFPPQATLCPKCQVKAAVLIDNCSTCLNCGESKCG
jgi:hypothetical protein